MKFSNILVSVIFSFNSLSYAIMGGHKIPTEGIYLSLQAQSHLASHLVGLVDTTDSSSHTTCSAVLITENIALTAAHCVFKNNSIDNLFIVPDEATFAVSARLKVSSFLVHPKYNPKNIIPKADSPNYDLALVKFEGPLPAQFKPVSLLNTTTDRKNIWPVAAGYGLTSREKMDSGILRFTLIKVDSFLTQQSFFMADQTKGQGICMGDSGGPVFMTQGENFVLMGITSVGVAYNPYVAGILAKDSCSGFSIFNNVLFYKNWIGAGIAQLN